MSPTEKLIIEAALKLFSEKGYVATSIRDISNAANITSATLYYYVNNKKDLLNQIMKNYLNQLIEDAEKAILSVNQNGPKEKLAKLIQIHVESHGKEQLAALVVDTEYRSMEGEEKKVVQALRKKYESLWMEVLEEGIESKLFHFTDSKVTAFALIGLCTGVAHWFREGQSYSIEEIAIQYIDLGLKMVTTD